MRSLHNDSPLGTEATRGLLNLARDALIADQVEHRVDAAVEGIAADDLMPPAAALRAQLKLDSDPAPVAINKQQIGIVKPRTALWAVPRQTHAKGFALAATGNSRGVGLGAITRAHGALGNHLCERAERAPACGQPQPGNADIVSDVEPALGHCKAAVDELEAPTLDAIVGWIAVEQRLSRNQSRMLERPQPPPSGFGGDAEQSLYVI